MFETMRENVATRIETKSQGLEPFHGLLPTLASTLDAAEVFQHLAARILPHDEANLALLTEDGTQFQEYRRTRTSERRVPPIVRSAISSLRNAKIAKQTCASCFQQSPRTERSIFPFPTGKVAV
jgi:hypothetical protein